MTRLDLTSAFIDGRRRKLLGAGLAGGIAGLAPQAWAQSRSGSARDERVLRVGYQKGWLSILKKQGTLEKLLAPLGVRLSWVEFNAGPVQLEALNVGSIDFGDVGEAPPIFAQAAGAALVYAAASVPRPAQEAVLLPKDSSIRSVQDLKGKRVAYNKGSNVHYFLVKLLEKHGLRYSDVQSVFLAPADARAAFERGAVDAWAIWDPFLAAAQQSLGAKVLADASGVVSNRYYLFTSRDYATHNADVLRIAVDAVRGVEAWAEKNRAAAAQELSQVLGLEQSITGLYIQRYSYGLGPVTREILAEQQGIADTFYELRLIPRKLNLLHAAPVQG
ncbi:aliphatic sulfonate ABC transporter substrate-binding protein [Comamonas composti]|uniref:aliphatic sulfonate ABC transporter substrate-binding protein n=1 Tax=Comamonas composti TaxID=408558 RepID=UPI00047AE38E|nr:aliphatic sulfonate ABC transporter substrate-binding protein [Comamonas composti]